MGWANTNTKGQLLSALLLKRKHKIDSIIAREACKPQLTLNGSWLVRKAFKNPNQLASDLEAQHQSS